MLEKSFVAGVFREVKKEAGLHFAKTSGHCCQTCTWYEIDSHFEKKGINEPNGIWVKHFTSGMNKSDFVNTQWVGHRLTPEQGQKVYEVLSRYFNVKWDMSEGQSIEITEKDGNVA